MTRSQASQAWQSLLRAARVAAVCAGAVVVMPSAHAQSGDDGSATEKLIQLLIAKGVLTHDQAASLLKQAQEEGRIAHKQRSLVRGVPSHAEPKVAATAVTATAEPPAPVVPPGTVRVTYVPQIVREQIADQVRQEVMQQVQGEGWASPGNAAPSWTQRIHIYGDMRLRGERVFEDPGNGPAIDFNSINSGSGFDTTNGGLPPTLNTLEDRTLFRVRARLGVNAQIDDGISADIGFATGNDDSPVSEYQTLGQPGDFAKSGIWLDHAYLLLQAPPTIVPFQSLKMYLGREPNPFWTTDLVYYDELNFDGGAIKGHFDINKAIDVFVNAGAFSLFNTDFNFSSLNTDKFPSHDKYLFAGQLGVDLRPQQDLAAKFAAGFFAYTNMDGKLSDPCTLLQTGDGCNTDDTRTQFVQYGNTLFPIRNIVVTGTSTSTPEYFGLASRFDILDLHGRVDYRGLGIPVALEGEFSKNFGFNRNLIASRGPVNNLGGTASTFEGGDTAYMLKLTLGKTDVSERWDWNTFIAYKYLESDSVLDALTDPNFHFGGTNAKGFIVGGDLGLARNLYIAARWFSASQVSGVPYSNDVLQVDLNARF